MRDLVGLLRDEYDERDFTEFLSMRTVERFLDGDNVRWGSVIKMGRALGLRRGTMALVREGDWDGAAELDNEQHIRAIIRSLQKREQDGPRNPGEPPSLPRAQGSA